jgi:protein tyrosine/serine phosphatase
MNDPVRFPPLQGIHNFRDYGGWPTTGGRRVRTGLLYRSGQHVAASEADLAAVAALDIRTVIDLRSNGERERNPCRRAPGWAGEVVFYDGETSNSPPHMDVEDGQVTEAAAVRRMTALYRRIPHNPAMHAIVGDYLRVLAARDGASLVHCFAGKDRTGIAVTLLLRILGASREDQLAEFLLTNEAPTYHVLHAQSLPHLEARFGPMEPAAVDALMRVRAEYFAAFEAEVAASYGTLDDFLAQRLAVDEPLRSALRSRFVT